MLIIDEKVGYRIDFSSNLYNEFLNNETEKTFARCFSFLPPSVMIYMVFATVNKGKLSFSQLSLLNILTEPNSLPKSILVLIWNVHIDLCVKYCLLPKYRTVLQALLKAYSEHIHYKRENIFIQ